MNESIENVRVSGQARSEIQQEELFDSVVIVSPFFWNFRDDMWQTTHHIARAFAHMVPTVLVEPPPMWNPKNAEFRMHRLFHSLFGRRTRTAEPNLTVFHRRSFPFGRVKTIREFDVAQNAKALRRLLKDLGFRSTLLWHSFPYLSESLVEAVDHTLFAYHCLDYSPREEEATLIKRADAVFCVSETLVQKHSLANPRTYLLPNGVDLTLFDADRAAPDTRPTDLPRNGRVIGFLGYVNYHVDIELLVEVARAFPNETVVLVGRVPISQTVPQGRQLEALDTLRTLQNVRVLGFKPTSQVPLYIHAFDVCLIPFLPNRFNEECDPLKFYQYLAMGKPIVSAPVAVAKRYREACYVAQSHEEFVRCISAAFEESKATDLTEKRIALARTHGWPALVTQACQILSQVRHSDAIQNPGKLG